MSTNIDGWGTKDTIAFNIPTSNTTQEYELKFQTRINRRYEYRDLWVEICTQYGPDSLPEKVCLTDTVRLMLVDKDDNFEAKGNELLNYSTPVRNLHIIEGEQGTIKICHIMNAPTIKGVHDIGVTLLPLEAVSAGVNPE